jgi:hypothetical protein
MVIGLAVLVLAAAYVMMVRMTRKDSGDQAAK